MLLRLLQPSQPDLPVSHREASVCPSLHIIICHFSNSVSDTCSCKVLNVLEEHDILGGYPLDDHRILWCCTEVNTKAEIDKVISFVDSIENLYCIGRNGQHRYNNMDHSMLTAFEAVDHILGKNKDKSIIWNVNTEKEYHEQKNYAPILSFSFSRFAPSLSSAIRCFNTATICLQGVCIVW